MREVPVDAIERMRYLGQDWNSLQFLIMEDGSGRVVAKFYNPREGEDVLEIVQWAIAFHDRAVEVTKEIEAYNR